MTCLGFFTAGRWVLSGMFSMSLSITVALNFVEVYIE
jgi:hypothetical protein